MQDTKSCVGNFPGKNNRTPLYKDWDKNSVVFLLLQKPNVLTMGIINY